MTPNKAQKIEAFKELLKISNTHSFDVYETSGNPAYGYRAWPVKWDERLYQSYKTPEDKQKALNETLMKLTCGDFPETIEEMEQERKVIRLTLLAGANPNCSDSYHGSVFESFWYSEKGYGLSELVKDDRFESPVKLQEFYERFDWKPIYCDDSNKEMLLKKQENENRADVIYTLFQKGMYPTNQKIFEKLAPVVLEKDPEFFNKRKEQTITQLTRAKTPAQIFNALMGKQKEKS